MKSLVFPGQGSQYVGMGRDLYDSFPEIKVIFEEVDDALEQKLSDIIFEGPENEKKELINLVTYEMENALKFKVPLKVDYNYGLSWYEAH